MWKVIWALILPNAVSLETGPPEALEIRERTVLIYEHESGNQQRQFVLRIARFHPDIVLEWESEAFQGTIHLFQKAVASASRFTVSSMFEAGMDIQGKKATTKWLSLKLFDQLLKEESVRLELNRVRGELTLQGEAVASLTIDRVPVEVPVVLVSDSRGGKWKLLKDPDNPLVVEYETPYYVERLKAVSTDPRNKLRWIRKLPSIK